MPSNYQPKIYRKQGGDEMVIANGGVVTVESTANIALPSGTNLASITPTAAELNLVDDHPANIGFAATSGSTNVCEVTVTAKDAAGTAMARAIPIDLWLSDAANGLNVTATTASGAVAAKASSGTDLGVLTTKKVLRVLTKADGTYILSITDSAKTGFYVAAAVPGTGKVCVSAQLVTGNYG